MAKMIGYVVRTTEAAVAFVAEENRNVKGVKPLWIPRKKIDSMVESDALAVFIDTAQDGERVGVPHTLDVCDAFLAKVAAA